MDLSVRDRTLGTVWNKSQSLPTSGTNAFLEAANVIREKKISPAPDASEENLAVGTYEQRLARLKKLHAETDYSGMEPRDRNKLIIDRFKAAFPDYTAILGGLYDKLGENTVYGRIREEASIQAVEACEGFSFPMQGKERAEFQRYVWGYDGMTEDEIRAAVHEKYDGRTLADKIAILQELSNMGIDREAAGLFLNIQVDIEMRKGTEREYGHLHTDNPIRINAMIAYAKGNQISWQGLCSGLMGEMQTHTFKTVDVSPEEAKRLRLAEIEDILMKFLDKIGHAENGKYKEDAVDSLTSDLMSARNFAVAQAFAAV